MAPVRLPKEVLNLFPSWEYRCPCCGTYVEKGVRFCSCCSSVFDEEHWRVPPRFLESPEAMSDYAHKVLAPRLTSKQRELLFLYFTEFFNDGFETGDFSAWTGTIGSPVVESNNPHHGSYNMRVDTTGSQYAHKTFTATSVAYARAYVKFNSLALGDNAHLHFLCIDDGDWQDSFRASIRKLSGTFYWACSVYANSNSVDYVSATALTVDVWYCVEVLRDVTSNIQNLYVDGVAVLEQTETITSDNSRLRCGTVYTSDSSENSYFVDCVVVADTIIGQETAQQTYTKTWASDVLFKKLGLTEPFSLDVALQKQDVTETFEADCLLLKPDITKNFSVDASFVNFFTPRTVSSQIDVLLKKPDVTKSFGLDTCFKGFLAETFSKNFGLDAVFAYKVRLPELWLDQNGKLVLNISKPYTWVGT